MPLGSLFSEAPLNFCDNPTLSNEWVTLEPLGLQHAEALAACVGDLSSLCYQDHIPTPGGVPEYIETKISPAASCATHASTPSWTLNGRR